VSRIEDAIKRNDWARARQFIRAALRQNPDSHWLITRLALTYYEQGDYKRSLALEQRAYKIAPNCPLVLWDMAGSWEMLKRYTEASTIYRRLLRRGVNAVAFGVCGEGVAWARGLLADCWYRLARCHRKQGRRAHSISCYKKHLAMRGPGCRSIYPIHEVRRELALSAAKK